MADTSSAIVATKKWPILISVLDPNSLSPDLDLDQDPSFQAEYRSGSGSRVFMTK
jgi:hypothetical protein